MIREEKRRITEETKRKEESLCRKKEGKRGHWGEERRVEVKEEERRVEVTGGHCRKRECSGVEWREKCGEKRR